jgi:hypothetical protein
MVLVVLLFAPTAAASLNGSPDVAIYVDGATATSA